MIEILKEALLPRKQVGQTTDLHLSLHSSKFPGLNPSSATEHLWQALHPDTSFQIDLTDLHILNSFTKPIVCPTPYSRRHSLGSDRILCKEASMLVADLKFSVLRLILQSHLLFCTRASTAASLE